MKVLKFGTKLIQMKTLNGHYFTFFLIILFFWHSSDYELTLPCLYCYIAQVYFLFFSLFGSGFCSPCVQFVFYHSLILHIYLCCLQLWVFLPICYISSLLLLFAEIAVISVCCLGRNEFEPDYLQNPPDIDWVQLV